MTKPTCTIEDCAKPRHSRGLCGMHAQRLKRNGDPHDCGSRIVGDDQTRFWSHIDKTATCWVWTGDTYVDGYGRFHIDGKQVRAHRWSYEQSVGPVPDGQELDHLCRNRPCVNPAHLQPVSHHVNILRGESPQALNARKTHCPQGHPYSGDNLYIIPATGGRACIACRERHDANRRATA